jgi:hypothetical protein
MAMVFKTVVLRYRSFSCNIQTGPKLLAAFSVLHAEAAAVKLSAERLNEVLVKSLSQQQFAGQQDWRLKPLLSAFSITKDVQHRIFKIHRP